MVGEPELSALPQISLDFTVQEYTCIWQNHKVLISRSNVSFVTEISAVLKYTVHFLSIINTTEALWGCRQVSSELQ